MGKLAFVFAGQGSQLAGMGKDLYDRFNCVKEIFDMSPEIRNICFDGPKEKLDITLNTQPAIFLMDMACAAILNENGIKADGAAGFSLGEIPAACYTGLMDLDQAYRFVLMRAKSMHECAQKSKGSMIVVLKLSDEKVEEICNSLPEAYPVNYNSPAQVVVACADGVEEKLIKTVSENGGKSIKLAVSGAFHSPFMNEAGENAAVYLSKEKFKEMQIHLYSNTTAKIYDNPGQLLAKQISSPVLWKKTIENMICDGFDTFIEVGPGKTLSGLIKKINPDVRTGNVSDIPSLEIVAEEYTNA